MCALILLKHELIEISSDGAINRVVNPIDDATEIMYLETLLGVPSLRRDSGVGFSTADVDLPKT